MWPFSSGSRKEAVTRRALSLTPNGGTRFDGLWSVREETSSGPILYSARLKQHGVSVEGWLQCKFAAAHPIEIRGVVTDGRMIGTWARPHHAHIGSGILQLAVNGDGMLEGKGTWFSPESSEPQTYKLRWERTGK